MGKMTKSNLITWHWLSLLVTFVPLLSPSASFLLLSTPNPDSNRKSTRLMDATSSPSSLDLRFRLATANDIDECYRIESDSYPSDEAASMDSLLYRQKHATDYFQLCCMGGNNNNNNSIGDRILGFVCGTRCAEFVEESMLTHVDAGPHLAIHSVVVQESHRRRGIATKMLQHYVQHIRKQPQGIESVVLLAKSHLLGFYVNCGFSVVRPSPIVHGKDLWYDLELVMLPKTVPDEDESWFVKTETFCKPFPEVKPHLAAHKEWVSGLRQQGYCITSGYRVDEEGKPGGGGLMFLAAKTYEDAKDLVLQDPLVATGCVEWKLNGWIGEVGNVQLR